MPAAPSLRLRRLSAASEPRPDGDYVLYWMTAFRRTHWNFSLQHAADWSRRLKKPLVIFEALRCGYRWASERLHAFVIAGMADNFLRLQNQRDRGVYYYPYLERKRNGGKGLYRELAEKACVVVSDDFPCFFPPKMLAAAAKQTPTLLESVDSNGLLPLRAADKTFSRAHDFRRFWRRHLADYWEQIPQADPLKNLRLPALAETSLKKIFTRWPAATLEELQKPETLLASLPIDHSVAPTAIQGGSQAGRKTWRDFLRGRLTNYAEDRNRPETNGASGLSPYLHFGHISPHQIFVEWKERAGWEPDRINPKALGKNAGWWGAEESEEAFLDQLCTWRELGYNLCGREPNYDQYESLPAWARETLAQHANDPRPVVYSQETLENAQTHDSLWNAAQRQLLREGRMHNYLRMLWGKKILEWSATPEESLEVMIELNNRYALDGRNPNSYSGIFWTLGRYDRAWGPERPIFGKIRYMSSDNTIRKLRVKNYLETYGEASPWNRQR